MSIRRTNRNRVTRNQRVTAHGEQHREKRPQRIATALTLAALEQARLEAEAAADVKEAPDG